MAHLIDCKLCMSNNERLQRQAMGCGYEPPAPDAQPWEPPTGSDAGYNLGPISEAFPRGVFAPTTCAGYTTRLPQVREAQRASQWAERGDIRAFTGESPTSALVDAVEILDAQKGASSYYYSTPAERGGGA